MKHFFLVLLFFSVLISCKKEEATAPESTPATTTPQTATYQSNLRTNLILTNNAGNFDTSFTFSGKYVKIIGSSQTWASFPSTNFNGHIADANNNFNGEILSCPNFMQQLAKQATWNAISSDFGNFQYVDSIPMATFATSSSTIPITFDAAQGIPISISGIENSDYVRLDDKDDLYFPGYAIKSYQQSGISFIQDTIKDFDLNNIPVNATLTLSINLGKTRYETINGHYYSYVLKTTTYYYNIKRIN